MIQAPQVLLEGLRNPNLIRRLWQNNEEALKAIRIAHPDLRDMAGAHYTVLFARLCKEQARIAELGNAATVTRKRANGRARFSHRPDDVIAELRGKVNGAGDRVPMADNIGSAPLTANVPEPGYMNGHSYEHGSEGDASDGKQRETMGERNTGGVQDGIGLQLPEGTAKQKEEDCRTESMITPQKSASRPLD